MSRKRKNNPGIPDFEIDSLARALLPAIQKLFETEEGKALLRAWGLKDTLVGIGNCILGYPAENPEARPRLDGRIVKIG